MANIRVNLTVNTMINMMIKRTRYILLNIMIKISMKFHAQWTQDAHRKWQQDLAWSRQAQVLGWPLPPFWTLNLGSGPAFNMSCNTT